MIVHCAKALAARLPVVSGEPLSEDCALGGWHAQLVNSSTVVFCHDASRYVLLLDPVADLENLGDQFADLLLRTLTAEGFQPTEIAAVARSIDPIRFDRSTDASVLATIAAVGRRIADLNSDDPVTASLGLSHRPTQIRGRPIWPDKEMAEMVQALQAGGARH